MFSPEQIEKIKDLIKKQVVVFAANNISSDMLSSDEKRTLRDAGVNVSKINPKDSMVYQAFAFGVMSGAIPKSKLNSLNYSSFSKYVKSPDFIPLSKPELATIKSLQEQSLHDIRGIRSRFEDFVDGQMVSSNRKEYEDTIRRNIEVGKSNKESLRIISNNISKELGDFGRNFDRSVQYVSHAAFNAGRASFVEQNYGDDAKMYFDVYQGACRHCIRLYLEAGIGSKPIVFSLKQLYANGSNIGKKSVDWKASLEGTHPFCRCTANPVPEGYEWDEEKKRFAPSSTSDRKVNRKSKIGIKFGDEEYTI